MAKLDAIYAKGIYSSVTLVTFDQEALFDANGILTFDVDNQLNGLPFKSFYVDFQNTEDYTWIGQFFSYDSLADNEISTMTITGLAGDLIAKVQTDLGSFITYNLGDGVHALAEFDPSRYEVEGQCIEAGNGVVIPLSGENVVCSEDRFKILVAYTTAGRDAIYPHDINTFAQSCISHLGGTFLASGINLSHMPVLAHVEVVPSLVESPDFLINNDPGDICRMDLENMYTNTNLINLRANKQADLVVIITKPYKSSTTGTEAGGYALEPAAAFGKAFCLVTGTRALDDSYSFIHEVSHLLGAHHEDDYSPGTPQQAHAYSFQTGFFNQHTRRTVVHSGLKPRLQVLSNPQVSVSGKAAGDYVDHNNSAEVDAYLPTLKAFYSDFALFTPLITMVQPAVCQQNGTATVSMPRNCSGPFTYQWSYSDNGLTWTNIPSSNVTTIPTFVPAPPFSAPPIFQNYNTRMYRVTVTGPLGTTTATKTAIYNCYSRALLQQLNALNEIKPAASVSPVPASNVFSVNILLAAEDYVTIQLFDLTGKQVAALFKGTVVSGLQQLKFENKYAAGNYLVRVQGKNINEAIKIIIK